MRLLSLIMFFVLGVVTSVSAGTYNYIDAKEVKNKIVDPQFHNYSLLGIALESGFNSKSAFNRVFKKFTRTTPSKFRDSQLPA